MATRLVSAPLLTTRAAAAIDRRAPGAVATLSALAFFVVYAGIHTAHALHHDLPGLARVSSVPLFSCCTASVAVAGAVALLATPLLRARPRMAVYLLPLLRVCVLLFTLVMVLLP